MWGFQVSFISKTSTNPMHTLWRRFVWNGFAIYPSKKVEFPCTFRSGVAMATFSLFWFPSM
jgi:hypothetical protein